MSVCSRPRVHVSRTATVLWATVAVASVLVVAYAARRSETPAAAGSRVTVTRPGLQPVAQQVVGASERGFRVARRGGVLVASGGGIASVFGSAGVRVSVPNGTVDLRLLSVDYGGRLLALARSAPVAAGNTVRYPRGDVIEWYRNGPFGLEQGFTVNPRPRNRAGTLTLALSLGGSLAPRLSNGDVAFVSSAGAPLLRYGDLSVVDASGRHLRSSLGLSGGQLFVHVWGRGARYPLRIDPFVQVGSTLTTSDKGGGFFGQSVALSADGATALIGGGGLEDAVGAGWVFTRSGSGWKKPARLTEVGATGGSNFGTSVAVSADGKTALVGGPDDNNGRGAVWVFEWSGSGWAQQGGKLTAGAKASSTTSFGWSVALSGDGKTALVGAPDYGSGGAAFVFKRSGFTWKLSTMLTGGGESGAGYFGGSVALSADGKTALIGGPHDLEGDGAAWVFIRSGSGWKQQAGKLTGGRATVDANFGDSVALSANGNTALIGGLDNNNSAGAAWVFTRSGSNWAQQAKLTGTGAFGFSVALSGDGNTALITGVNANAGWAFTRSGKKWTQQNPTLAASGATGDHDLTGHAAISADGKTALIGGSIRNGSSFRSVVWTFGFSCGVACLSTTPAPGPIVPPTTPPPPATTGTAVTVITEAVVPFTFTLSTATQPKIVSDTPGKAELDVPPGTVTFTVSNPSSNILSHTFEVCTTPLAKPVTTLPGVQALPNSCTGAATPLLAPGGATATLTVDLTTPGAYEYLSTANNPGGDASSGMKGVLNVT